MEPDLTIFMDQLCGKLHEDETETWLTFVGHNLYDASLHIYGEKKDIRSYIYRYQATFLRYGRVLDEYNDWKRNSQYPISSIVDIERLRVMIDGYVYYWHNIALSGHNESTDAYTTRVTIDACSKRNDPDCNLILCVVNEWAESVRRVMKKYS